MTDKILEVRGLTKTYGGEKRKGAKQAAPTLDVLRGIDIDILLIDDLKIDEPDFKVPHPLMEERDFVMKPLKEILK